MSLRFFHSINRNKEINFPCLIYLRLKTETQDLVQFYTWCSRPQPLKEYPEPDLGQTLFSQLQLWKVHHIYWGSHCQKLQSFWHTSSSLESRQATKNCILEHIYLYDTILCYLWIVFSFCTKRQAATFIRNPFDVASCFTIFFGVSTTFSNVSV